MNQDEKGEPGHVEIGVDNVDRLRPERRGHSEACADDDSSAQGSSRSFKPLPSEEDNNSTRAKLLRTTDAGNSKRTRSGHRHRQSIFERPNKVPEALIPDFMPRPTISGSKRPLPVEQIKDSKETGDSLNK